MRSLVAAAIALTLVVALPATAAEKPVTGPDPAVAEWPDWTLPTTCNGPEEAFDPLLGFSGPTGAERGSSPAEKAIRRIKREQRTWFEPLVTGRDWRLIEETETRAQFTRGRLSGTLEWLELERDQAGKWNFNGYSSDCDPTAVLDSGTVVSWSLARRQKHLNPRSRTLWVDLGPGECSSGTPQNPRAHFRFETLGKKLLMIAWLTPVTGGGTCIGIFEHPRKVRLPAPLGDLRLYDGATFPPVPAGKTRVRY